MTTILKTFRNAVTVATIVLATTTVYAQEYSGWKTAADIRNGARGSIVGSVSDISESRGELTIVPDGSTAKIRVTTDSLVTTYRGFGEAKPGEILEGTAGFSRVRAGDRLEVRGQGAEEATVAALDIVLLGRSVTVEKIGTPALRAIDGTVRSVSRNNRFVIETERREMYTIIGTAETPVTYRSGQYRIPNLEVGDRVRVAVATMTGDGVTARSIDVLESVSEAPLAEGRTVTSVTGRVTRVDQRLKTFRISSERNREIRVDASEAVGADERVFRIANLRVGDNVEITGEYDEADLFRADTVRVGAQVETEALNADDFASDYDIATFSGRVITEWTDGVLRVEDNRDSRRYDIRAFDGFVVQTRSGYTNVERVKSGDRISVTAFVDHAGRLIAQTLRLR
jgi:hypothetical protein